MKLQLKEHMLQTLKLVYQWQADYIWFRITFQLFQKQKSDFIKSDIIVSI